MTVIRELAVALRLQADNFNNGIKAAQREAKEFEKVLRPTTQLLGDMGKAMTSAGQVATLSLTAPIVAFGAIAVKNFNESAQAVALMENAIRSTGGTAGKTSDQLTAMATALESNSIFGDDQIIQKVITQLLTFTNVSGEAFDRAAQAALNMSTVLGQDLQSSAIQLGKALNDPVEGVTALQRVGVRLTESQKDLIQSFMLSNDIMGAQNVILDELEKQFGGAAKAAAEVGSGPMTVLWNRVGNLTESWGELISEAMIPFIEIATKVVEEINTWDRSTKQVVLVLGALAAAAGPVLLVLGTMASSLSSIIALYAKFAPLMTTSVIPAVQSFGASMSALVIANGPLILTVAAVTSLGIALFKLKEAFDASNKAQDDATMHMAEAAASTERAAKALKEKYGIQIDRGTLSTQAWAEAIAFAANRAAKLEESTVKLTTTITKSSDLQAQFAQRLRLERERDAKDLDKQFAAYKKNVEDAEEAQKKLAKETVAAQKAARDAIALQNRELIDQRRELGLLRPLWDNVAEQRVIEEAKLHIQIQNVNRGLQDQHDELIRTAGTITPIRMEWDAVNEAVFQTNAKLKIGTDNTKELSKATEDVKRSAGEMFDAMFVKGENVFTSLKNLLKGGVLSLGRAIFEDIVGELLGPIKKAFDDFFEGLLEGTGIKALVSGLGQKLGGALSGIFGGGAGAFTGPIQQGAGAAGGVAGSVGSIGGAAGSLGSAALGGAISAAGSIVGALIGEGNARRTEENTRESRDWLEIMAVAWNPLFHKMAYFMEFSFEPMIREIRDLLFEIRVDALPNGFASLQNAPAAPGGAAGAGQTTLVLNVDGQRLATVMIPHFLTLSTNNAMVVTGVR